MQEDLFVAICSGLWVLFSGCNRRAPTKLNSNLQQCQWKENRGIWYTHTRIKSIFGNCGLVTISIFLLLINFHTSKKTNFCSLLMVYVCLCLILFKCTLKYPANSVSFWCWAASSSNVLSLTKSQLKKYAQCNYLFLFFHFSSVPTAVSNHCKDKRIGWKHCSESISLKRTSGFLLSTFSQ